MGKIIDRMQEYLNQKGITAYRVEKDLGKPKGSWCKVSNPTAELITLFYNTYDDINPSWLMTGEGDMLIDSSDSQPKISYNKGVPYYDVDFLGGFSELPNDQTAIPAYKIDFKIFNKATCWCNITGHSMEPEINHGDIIALREIEDFSFLPIGEVYAFVTTNNMRTVKRLGASKNPDNYLLVPTNKSPEFAEQELPKKMVCAVFEVMACMKKL